MAFCKAYEYIWLNQNIDLLMICNCETCGQRGHDSILTIQKCVMRVLYSLPTKFLMSLLKLVDKYCSIHLVSTLYINVANEIKLTFNSIFVAYYSNTWLPYSELLFKSLIDAALQKSQFGLSHFYANYFIIH